jgi:hypothetical protein
VSELVWGVVLRGEGRRALGWASAQPGSPDSLPHFCLSLGTARSKGEWAACEGWGPGTGTGGTLGSSSRGV